MLTEYELSSKDYFICTSSISIFTHHLTEYLQCVCTCIACVLNMKIPKYISCFFFFLCFCNTFNLITDVKYEMFCSEVKKEKHHLRIYNNVPKYAFHTHTMTAQQTFSLLNPSTCVLPPRKPMECTLMHSMTLCPSHSIKYRWYKHVVTLRFFPAQHHGAILFPCVPINTTCALKPQTGYFKPYQRHICNYQGRTISFLQ